MLIIFAISYRQNIDMKNLISHITSRNIKMAQRVGILCTATIRGTEFCHRNVYVLQQGAR